jgi:hypothetical protein
VCTVLVNSYGFMCVWLVGWLGCGKMGSLVIFSCIFGLCGLMFNSRKLSVLNCGVV